MAILKAGRELQAFLDLIAASEGTSSSPITRNDGYDIIVTGYDGRHRFEDYSIHPFSLGREPIKLRDNLNPPRSTASGRYQIILPTWRHLAKTYSLGTFSPQNQDIAALYLLEECHASGLVQCGEITDAISRSSLVWASFPGNVYGQPTHPIDFLLLTYKALFDAQSV
jgi:muramidase (phage lysozyme)